VLYSQLKLMGKIHCQGNAR